MQWLRRDLLCRLHTFALGLTGAALTIFPTGASGQRIVRVENQVACSTCTLELLRRVTLAAPDHVIFPSLPPVSVVRDSRKNFVVGPVVADLALAIFKPNGSLAHLYGKLGSGPSEFLNSNAPMVIRPSDSGSIYVSQMQNVHVLNAGASATLRRFSIPLIPHDVVVLGDKLFAQWTVDEIGGAATPIQVLSAAGSLERGLGATANRPLSRSNPYEKYRKLSHTTDGKGLWSAYVTRYEISRFGTDGHEQLRLARVADWFPSYDNSLAGELFGVPQRPRVEGVLESSNGLLWVAISQGARKFEPALKSASPQEMPLNRYVDFNRLLDTTIEVIDVSKGAVIARRRFDGYLRFVSTRDNEVLLYSVKQGASGETTIDIYAGTLAGYSPPR